MKMNIQTFIFTSMSLLNNVKSGPKGYFVIFSLPSGVIKVCHVHGITRRLFGSLELRALVPLNHFNFKDGVNIFGQF